VTTVVELTAVVPVVEVVVAPTPPCVPGSVAATAEARPPEQQRREHAETEHKPD